MVVWNRTPAHESWDDRDTGDLGEFDEQRASVRIDDAAARNNERALRCVQHRECLLDLRLCGLRLVDRQRLVGFDVEFYLAHLHVEGKINQHGSGTARAHQVKCLLESPWHKRRLPHRDRPFCHRLRDRLDVHRLKVLFMEAGTRCLSGDAQDWNGIRPRGVETGDHIGSSWTRGADAYADVTRLCPRVAFGHVRGTFDMPGEKMFDLVARA